MDPTDYVLLHGFTQTGASWDRVRLALERQGATVSCPDLPGHGTATDQRATLWETADLVATTHGRQVWMGYSMGARVALHVALAHPEVVDGLVLLSGTAGIDDAGARAERRLLDDDRAGLLERDGVPTFLASWLAQPLFAGVPPDPVERAGRLANTAAGLASSLRLAGTGTMDPPLWNRLEEISAPTLVLAGVRDEKFARLGRRLAAGIGANATFRLIDDAGHAAHLEQPEAVSDLVQRWRTGSR